MSESEDWNDGYITEGCDRCYTIKHANIAEKNGYITLVSIGYGVLCTLLCTTHTHLAAIRRVFVFIPLR